MEDTVRVSRLANGLTVATDTMPGIDSAALGVWIGVGARHEPEGANGVAHFLEHMLFKGTQRRSAFDISAQIENVGGYLNAYTGREITAYHARVLAGDVPLAMDLLADMIRFSTFDPQELERERGVILQEIGQYQDTPDEIIFDHAQEAAFPGQLVGRPILGTPETVGRLSRQDLIDYRDPRYRPSRMVAVAAGKVDHQAFLDLVEKYYGDLPKDETPFAAPETARFSGGDCMQSRELEQLHLIMAFEGVAYGRPEYEAHAVYSSVLAGGMSSRLFQEVREKRGLVYSIHTYGASLRDGGLFGIYAGTAADKVQELMPVVCEELSKMTSGVSQEELDRAKAQMRSGILMVQESTSSRAEKLANQILIHGRPIPPAERIARIEAVTVDDVHRQAKRLCASPALVVALGDVSGVKSSRQIASLISS
ncbi:MAG: insulinase family protein [Alphaproteobacteria bacterium]|nr:MAG: insulinase family protein [Alphaproteobacteria bacterium]